LSGLFFDRTEFCKSAIQVAEKRICRLAGSRLTVRGGFMPSNRDTSRTMDDKNPKSATDPAPDDDRHLRCFVTPLRDRARTMDDRKSQITCRTSTRLASAPVKAGEPLPDKVLRDTALRKYQAGNFNIDLELIACRVVNET
jgi:hypothetical protein